MDFLLTINIVRIAWRKDLRFSAEVALITSKAIRVWAMRIAPRSWVRNSEEEPVGLLVVAWWHQ